MGKPVLKNWSPKDVVRFLKKNGFVEMKAKGDHCGLYSKDLHAHTEVDMNHGSFYASEMLAFVQQTKIAKEKWVKNQKIS